MIHAQGAIVTLTLILFAVSSCPADEYLWDQTNDWFNPSLSQSIEHFSPIGQEFTPNLDYVEVFQLWIYNVSEYPGDFVVNIRSNSITGPLLGTSSTSTLPGWFIGLVTFDFEPVPLVPQTLYVIELVQTVGTGGSVYSKGDSQSTYPLGCQILWGLPQDNNDLWFREGILEVSALQMMTWGSLKNLCW